MDKDREKGMDRRDFIRKAAITGAVAWAVPAIQTVAATPAFAGVQGSPPCVHGLCVSACTTGGCENDDLCEDECDLLCLPEGTPGGGRRCCIQACDIENWNDTPCEFTGSTTGCPPEA
jgi:hypothetical protein